MNWIDILLLIVVLFGMIGGWSRGFIETSVNLLVWLLSLGAGFYFYPYIASWLEKVLTVGPWLLPISFMLAIMLARILLFFIAQPILSSIPESTHQGWFNRTLGLVPGFVNGVIWAVIVAALLLGLPLSQHISDTARESKLAGRLAVQAEWLEEKLSPVFDKAVDQSLNKLTVKPDSESTVQLNFTEPNPKDRPDLAAAMLVLVNEERSKQGLPALKADPEIAVVAKAHSKDMFARGYFSHYTLEGKNLAYRLDQKHIDYKNAGENLALAQTLTLAHNGLMNSPGHRKNILAPQFGRVGIAVLDGGVHGLMITQNFRN